MFSTNLIFETTKSADTLNSGLAGLCWSVHESALSVIQPEVIITCGNDQEKSAFSFIADLYCGKIEQKFLSGTFTIKYSKIFTTKILANMHNPEIAFQPVRYRESENTGTKQQKSATIIIAN